MSTATQAVGHRGRGRTRTAEVAQQHRPRTAKRTLLHVFLIVMSLSWVFPLAWAVFNSLRDYNYTSQHGYVSFGGFTLKNYANAWKQGDFGRHFWNSVIITVPSVLVTLILASAVAFVVSRYSFKANIVLLGLFTAANLLPQQALLVPLFKAVQLDRGAVLVQRVGHALQQPGPSSSRTSRSRPASAPSC
ncbi:hypothetical protein GCM10025868_34790 [Angustibacter aerolatus]|uniref:ABC transmembrane type-1 domain-containing protein n=1 Tax=Angustibacter aerolatus TaxID=1162965 RepID=A0ABQ6JK20_9ACTN|nr:hypothetical protein [Angustibacter aerolatus]GMA88229.1 hypothetical protein GCM10025868_34790 [Angustibacter aerolatus]